MAKQEFAQIKIVLPRKSKMYGYSTSITVDGKPLKVSNYSLSTSGMEGRAELILHIQPEGFDIEIEDVQFK